MMIVTVRYRWNGRSIPQWPAQDLVTLKRTNPFSYRRSLVQRAPVPELCWSFAHFTAPQWREIGESIWEIRTLFSDVLHMSLIGKVFTKKVLSCITNPVGWFRV